MNTKVNILQMSFLNALFWIKIIVFRFKFDLSLFFSKDAIDVPALVQVIVLCRIGDKSLPESMTFQLTDTYKHHQTSMG